MARPSLIILDVCGDYHCICRHIIQVNNSVSYKKYYTIKFLSCEVGRRIRDVWRPGRILLHRTHWGQCLWWDSTCWWEEEHSVIYVITIPEGLGSDLGLITLHYDVFVYKGNQKRRIRGSERREEWVTPGGYLHHRRAPADRWWTVINCSTCSILFRH